MASSQNSVFTGFPYWLSDSVFLLLPASLVFVIFCSFILHFYFYLLRFDGICPDFSRMLDEIGI
jgi:uncharacterized membrane protein YhdT